MERKPHILLVDDEADFLAPVSFWLQSKGYRVRTTLNGEEAIQLIKQELPDMVFLDIHMPGMDGLATLTQIRQISKDLPVIIVTAVYQNEKTFAKANELGISGFFPKHSSLSELVRIIETSLRAHAKLKGSVESETSPSP
jgi:CheY-like chemotaxis protein